MATAMMTAACIDAPGSVRLVRVPRPTPAADQVLFRVEGTGVCASNLGAWRGLPWISYPLAPGEGGHEAYGIVEDVGASVATVKPGDRIAALSYRAYAEYDVARASDVVVLPLRLARQPFVGEAVACAMNIMARSRVAAGEVVGVVGIGFLGAIAVKLATKRGASVIAVTRRQSGLDLARTLGADHAVSMHAYDSAVDQVSTITDGHMCNRVIEVAGYQTPLDLASDIVAERGTLIIAGYHQEGPRYVKMQQWNWRGIDIINAHERDPQVYVAGMRRGLAAVLEGDIDLAQLVTHEYALTDLKIALDATRDKPAGFIKAVVHP